MAQSEVDVDELVEVVDTEEIVEDAKLDKLDEDSVEELLVGRMLASPHTRAISVALVVMMNVWAPSLGYASPQSRSLYRATLLYS